MIVERSDEELLQAIVRQDGSALEALYIRYGGIAFALALRITANRETAEEVVQEAFLSVWRRGSTYEEGRGSARTWLLPASSITARSIAFVHGCPEVQLW